MNQCECGCGQQVKNRFKWGHQFKVNNPMKDPDVVKKQHERSAVTYKEKWQDEIFKKKMSDVYKLAWNDDERRKNKSKSMSDSLRLLWTDTVYREKQSISRSESWKSRSNYKGGIYQKKYCDVWYDKEFKQEILVRDDHKCQNYLCNGKFKDKLNIHHIDYDKTNCNPNNLITICVSCNTRANTYRSLWEFFYTVQMIRRGLLNA